MENIRLKLLIVDDKPIERNGIKEIIDWNELGIEIAGEAENGLEGIEKARELSPDIIISDIVMPRMDGLKMVEEIKKFLPDIKVIFISCFDNFNFAKTAIGMDAMGYVLKPLISGELYETVKKVTGAHLRELERKKEESDLIKRLNESLPLLREQFAKNLLYGEYRDEDDIWDRNRFLKTGFVKGCFQVVVISIKNTGIPFKEISKYIEGIFRAVFPEHKYILAVDNSSIPVIMNFLPEEKCRMAGSMPTLIEKIKSGLFEQFSIKPGIGISNAVDSVTQIKACFEEAKMQIPDNGEPARQQDILPASESKDRKVIEAMKEYIRCHYMEDLTVGKIAESAYLSASYANHIFKKETGITLMEYLTRTRIDEAKHLLRSTLLKVYEIAEKTGFKNNAHFGAVFKEQCGMTPLEYRDGKVI